MIFTKFFKILIVLIGVILLVFSNDISVSALNSNTETQLMPKKLQQSSEGAIVNFSPEVNGGGYGINVSLNTEKLQKKYYTALLYENLITDWSKYGMVSFHVDNRSEGQLRLNFVIQQSDSTSLVVKNNKPVLIRKDNGSLIEMVNIDNGSIDFDKGFKGTVYIPFRSLAKEGESENKQYTISNILSWGIIATMAENEVKNFTLKNFSLIGKEKTISEGDKLNISVSGDGEVEVPVVGEAIYQYAVKAYDAEGKPQNEKVKFQLDTDVQGATISEDGRLTIKSDLELEKIRVNAIINDTLSVNKEISLLKSWTLSAEEVDGTSKSIPKPYELDILMKNNTKLLLNNYVLNLIRIILVLAAISFSVLFFKWRKANN